MPYKDPEKKREYMKKYNKEWYGENKESYNLISKNTSRKRDLRNNKRNFLMDSLGNFCPSCGGESVGNIKLHIISDAPLGKPIADHSWPQIKIMLANRKVSLICTACKCKGTPEENTS